MSRLRLASHRALPDPEEAVRHPRRHIQEREIEHKPCRVCGDRLTLWGRPCRRCVESMDYDRLERESNR